MLTWRLQTDSISTLLEHEIIYDIRGSVQTARCLSLAGSGVPLLTASSMGVSTLPFSQHVVFEHILSAPAQISPEPPLQQ